MLILSTDVVAAALVGALVETLGYQVRFFAPPETPDEAIRRSKPAIVMIDGDSPTLVNTEIVGRARMRGVSVILFGSTDAIESVREIVHEYELETVTMPATLDDFEESLRAAIAKTC